MNDFQWIEDIDCNNTKLKWTAKHNWYSRRFNKKFKKALKNWVHPSELIKITAVHGCIERQIFSIPWVFIVINTNVGQVWIRNSYSMGEQMYWMDINKHGKWVVSKEFNKKMKPEYIIDFMNENLTGGL